MRESDATRARSSAWSNGFCTKSLAPPLSDSPRPQPLDPLLRTAGRDHHDRDERGPLVRPDPAAHLVAVHAWHQDVEEDEVDRMGVQEVEGLLAAGRGEHRVT